jgi:phospholipase C
MFRIPPWTYARGVLIAVVALVAAAACDGPAGAAHAPAVSTNKGGHPNSMRRFSHVIVIIEENRTLDNLFNGFPGADTVTSGNRFGVEVPLAEVPLQPSSGGNHAHAGFVADYDNGKMDGFDWAGGPTTYAYVRPSDVANYWTLATRFKLADEVFQMNMGPSFAAHVFLVAGQGGYPFSISGNETGKPVGCFGAQQKAPHLDLRTPFPGKKAGGLACTDIPTIFDLLDTAHVSWRYYTSNFGITKEFWSAPDYIRHIAKGPDKQFEIHPETRVLGDIAKGTLPQVAYVVPQCAASDHPTNQPLKDPLGGPHWVASITNAIGASPQYWRNTLILVTWDDWGGWYDHVAPPILNANSLSFRTPLLIVSAFPNGAGAVDHTKRNQGSILTAIESVFGLPSLNQLDSQSDDLHTAFNFNQPAVKYGAPLPAATPDPTTKCTGRSGHAYDIDPDD